MLINMLWSLVAFVIAFSLIITVHEFGHFFAARYCGLQVERFSIGFGKPIWRYCDRHGTEFVFALIPIGGYVRLLDDTKELLVGSKRVYHAFHNKTIGQCVAVIIAGPIANFIFAIFSYWLVFMIGIPSIKPIVEGVIPHSIAESANITSGMEIKEIDGIKTDDWNAVRMQLITKLGDDHSVFKVSFPNSDKQQEKIIDLHNWVFNPNKEDSITSLGILYYNTSWIEPVLEHVQPNSAAYKAGLQVGDRIIKVNNKFIKNWMMFFSLVRDNPGKPLILHIERHGVPLSLTLVPDTKLVAGKKEESCAGMIPKITSIYNKHKTIRRYDLVNAIVEATNTTWQLMKLTLKMLKKLIVGDLKLNTLSGPISIAQGAGESAKFGVVHYLVFLSIISVNVGVINLFPMPILDGGNLLFLLIKKLIKEPISSKIQDISYRISFFILMVFIWFVLFNDFSRILEK